MTKVLSLKGTAADELTEITISEQFGKGKKIGAKAMTNNCVLYTRVSSKRQEQGYSLDIQLKEEQEFVRKEELNVLGIFGGACENRTHPICLQSRFAGLGTLHPIVALAGLEPARFGL